MTGIELQNLAVMKLIAEHPNAACFTWEIANDDRNLLALTLLHKKIDHLVKLEYVTSEFRNREGNPFPLRFVALTDAGKQWLEESQSKTT